MNSSKSKLTGQQQSNDVLSEDDKDSTSRAYLYLLTAIAAIGGFLFGYDTGVISGAMILLKEQFGLSNTWQEVIVSVTVGFAAVFALIGSPLNNCLGRKGVILISSLIFTTGSVLLGFSNTKTMLLIGRAVVGAAIGLSSMTIPMYIAESSPPEIRGKLVTTNILFVTGGQIIASCVDGIFSEDKVNGWRYMLGLAAAPAILQFFGFLFLPESPRWLIQKGKTLRAIAALKKILGSETKARHEVETLERLFEEQTDRDVSCFRILSQPATRRALVVGCGLQMFQQLIGINTVMYYSATIIQMSGVRDDTQVIWLAAAVASMNFFGSAIGIYLVERLGRRTLSLVSMAGVMLALLFLSFSFYFPALDTPKVTMNSTDINQDHYNCYLHGLCEPCMLDDHCGFCYMEDNNGTIFQSSCVPTSNDLKHSSIGRCKNISTTSGDGPFFAENYCPTQYSWMALLGLVFYLFCFAPGMGPVPWTVNSEIYPQWARSTGNALSTGTNWVFNVVISLTFLHISQTLTYQGAFLMYSGFAFLGFIFVFLLLPETKDKPLEEIENLFSMGWLACRNTPGKLYQVILNSESDDENTLFVQ